MRSVTWPPPSRGTPEPSWPRAAALKVSPPASRSAPAQNARPSPVTMTARTSSSASVRSKASRSSRPMTPVKAFILSGRFRGMVATLSATSQRTCSKSMAGVLSRLAGRADQDLVDADMLWLGDGVDDRVGDVVGVERAHLAERLPDDLLDLRAVVGDELGADGARLDERDPDVTLGDLLAQRLAEGADRPLGRAVDAVAGARDAARHRADVDDVARALLEHDRQRGVRAVQKPEDVDLDHRAPLVGRRVDDRAEQHHAGVVDEDVEAAELGVGALDEGARLCLVGDVGRDGERAAAGAVDLLRERFDAIGAAGGGGRRGAPPRAGGGGGPPPGPPGGRGGGPRAAPAGAQARAVASPMPEEAPVTATTVPVRSAAVMALGWRIHVLRRRLPPPGPAPGGRRRLAFRPRPRGLRRQLLLRLL